MVTTSGAVTVWNCPGWAQVLASLLHVAARPTTLVIGAALLAVGLLRARRAAPLSPRRVAWAAVLVVACAFIAFFVVGRLGPHVCG